MDSATSLLFATQDFDRVMSAMYALSALCMAAAALFTRRMTPAFDALETKKQNSGLLATLKLPTFHALLPPNVLRGFNTGVVGILATIGIYELGLSAAQTGFHCGRVCLYAPDAARAGGQAVSGVQRADAVHAADASGRAQFFCVCNGVCGAEVCVGHCG